MKHLVFSLSLALLAAPAAAAEPMTFSCERFKSQCTGEACTQIYMNLPRDTERTILTKRRTQLVEYVITPAGATETLKSAQEAEDRGKPLVIHYKDVKNAYGRIVMSNGDAASVKEKAEIEPTSGLYRYYLLHTDGSIKDVPVGEPYTAYFGWCANKSPAGASLPDTTPLEDLPVAEESKPETVIPDVIAPPEPVSTP